MKVCEGLHEGQTPIKTHEQHLAKTLYHQVLSGDVHMPHTLLSIDWDYFISDQNHQVLSFIENKRTVLDLWYKRYLQSQRSGINLMHLYFLSPDVKNFWTKIRSVFTIDSKPHVFVSDSHKLSYYIAKHYSCEHVYSFDAHADLGYGGLSSLDYEVNCGNWLGKLFRDKLIKSASIIYSPFTYETPENFEEINRLFNIEYISHDELEILGHKQSFQRTNIISYIHICRSGAWTPPWYDADFDQFVQDLQFSYKIIKCPKREWDVQHLSLADQYYYLLA